MPLQLQGTTRKDIEECCLTMRHLVRIEHVPLAHIVFSRRRILQGHLHPRFKSDENCIGSSI